jgi:hypothetical protein
MRKHNNLYSEYEFLVKKVKKLKQRWEGEEKIQQKRLMRKARQFIKRMLDIKEQLQEMGYPDPEVVKVQKPTNLTNFDNSMLYKSPHLLSTDGSLNPIMQKNLLQEKLKKAEFCTTVS